MKEQLAREADKNEDITTAILLYEDIIKNGKAELLDYLNLICIYSNCLDFGYSSAFQIPIEIEGTACTRALDTISKAEEKFGTNDELTFWKSYIPHLGLGDDMPENLELKGNSLVPYIYLTLKNPTKENFEKAKQLYRESKILENSQRKQLILNELEITFTRIKDTNHKRQDSHFLKNL